MANASNPGYWDEPKVAVVGGAGFIGSHFVDSLLASTKTERVTVFDNFSSGDECHLADHRNDPRLRIVRGDAGDLNALTECLTGHTLAIHLASNPDIAKAMEDPGVDFRQGTLLTFNVVEAMRTAGVKKILYASGSGVYGDQGLREMRENFGPLIPISTYGASKLAGEALLACYCYMFGFRARAFRFANVVGPRQTHGVGLDFARRLAADPCKLRILGDGSQSKSYIHVLDILEAVRTAHDHDGPAFEAFNVGTGDSITVTEIAALAVDALGLRADAVELSYTGGDRGWKGDVPVVRLNCDRIRALGWRPTMTSRQAISRSIREILAGPRAA
ncbi:MAG: NAD-dependent epimerase/dehydratase family protein [Acidobacteriia bacterium]|nr:NAD-dependent epimerase/dehydratase family protein [Terriglobia bacterium]